MTEAEEKYFNGTYTRMLRKTVNMHWSSHMKNETLYGKHHALSDKIAARRDTLNRDTGVGNSAELAALMADRNVWRKHVPPTGAISNYFQRFGLQPA